MDSEGMTGRGRDIAPGAMIAHRYRLERPLGQGGMGVVWAALDPSGATHAEIGDPVTITEAHGEASLARSHRLKCIEPGPQSTSARLGKPRAHGILG